MDQYREQKKYRVEMELKKAKILAINRGPL